MYWEWRFRSWTFFHYLMLSQVLSLVPTEKTIVAVREEFARVLGEWLSAMAAEPLLFY